MDTPITNNKKPCSKQKAPNTKANGGHEIAFDIAINAPI